MAVRAAATTFGVSIAYIYNALIRRRLTGETGINPNCGHAPRKLSGEQELALAAHMRSRPGVTLVQAQAWLVAEHGVELSTGATWNAVRRLGLSFKKRMARPVCKQNFEADLMGLRKRIRHVGTMAAAKMEIRASWSS